MPPDYGKEAYASYNKWEGDLLRILAITSIKAKAVSNSFPNFYDYEWN
jgi:hypothetical protein